MIRVLVTGARGFVGRNLVAHLSARNDCEVFAFDQEHSERDLENWLSVVDVVFHFAGVNRPNDASEYESGNAGFTGAICRKLEERGRHPRIVFASSVQAELDNPYGKSKLHAEQTLEEFASRTGAEVRVYRLKNLFGKWCRPNYNSVTATFCFNIANELPITFSNPSNEIELSYIDDVVASFLAELEAPSAVPEIRSKRIRLDDLAGRIQVFHDMRKTLNIPDFSDPFNRALYATYLSYVPAEEQIYGLDIKADNRGSLAEFIKSKNGGQIFVSRTKPGITRGNHYHHTKTEKFFVVEGEGIIRVRQIESAEVVEFRVQGDSYQVIDIPVGFTHSIENVGPGEMVTIFWASEIFNPDLPDTYYLPVLTSATETARVTP